MQRTSRNSVDPQGRNRDFPCFRDWLHGIDPSGEAERQFVVKVRKARQFPGRSARRSEWESVRNYLSGASTATQGIAARLWFSYMDARFARRPSIRQLVG